MDDLFDKFDVYKKYIIDNTKLEEPLFNPDDYGCDYADIEYEKEYGNKLDLYLPKTMKNGPILIYIHGGGFVLGTKRCNPRPLIMREYGYTVAMIEYSNVFDAIFPTQIRQVKQAISYLRKNEKLYGYDASKIVVYGESAGGNLAALAGTTGNKERFGLPGNCDYSVQAVITDFAPINFITAPGENSLIKIKGENPFLPKYQVALYIGAFMQDYPERIEKTNPETYVNEECPPFYIQHGMLHELPYTQATTFAKKLIDKIGTEKVYLSLLSEVGGGDDPNYFTESNTMKKIMFLKKFLA